MHQQQQTQQQQAQQQPPPSHHTQNLHTHPNQQQQHHHSHHSASMNQPHQMHHSQPHHHQQQGQPLVPPTPPHHQSHPMNPMHPSQNHPHHHHHNQPHAHHNHHHPAQQQQQTHPSHQQQQQPTGPPQITQQQHPHHPATLPGPMHPAAQQQPNQLTHHPQTQPHQQPHHSHPHLHGPHMSHVHPPPQPHGPHTGQHSQPNPHHGTGSMQQSRQLHQHAQAHQQIHHPHGHPPQQQLSHHMATAHHTMAPHQLMHPPYISPYHHHVAPHAFPGAAPPPYAQNPATGLRNEAPSSLNSQQQPTSINANNMQISQIPPPVNSTAPTGTSNVHHQSNNGVMDPAMQSRLSLNQPTYMVQGGPFSFSPHMFPYITPYGQMPPGPLMPHRMPSDLSQIRPPYDPHTHAAIASKVPHSQATIMGAKQPGNSPVIPTGMSSAPNTVAAPLPKRVRRPANIKDPETGRKIELEKLAEPNKTETAAIPQNEAQAITAPAIIPTSQQVTTQTSTATTSTSLAAESTPVEPEVTMAASTSTTTTTTILNLGESVDLKMKNLSLDSKKPDHEAVSQAANVGNVIQPLANQSTASVAETSPKSAQVPLNGQRTEVISTNKSETQLPSPSLVQSSASNTLSPQHLTPKANISSPKEVVEKIELPEPVKEPTGNDEPDRAMTLSREPVNESNNSVIQGKTDENSISNSVSNPEGDTAVEGSKEAEETEKTLPQLPYLAGQYSPSNPTGRRKYTHEFLYAVYDLMQPELGDSQPVGHSNHRVDFMAPSYINNPAYNSNYRDLPSSRRSSQQAVVRPKRIIATSSLQPEIELKTSENAWKPELEQEKNKAVEKEIDTMRLIKIFRGHLNKLTPQKYDSIIEKIAQLDLDGPERLPKVIDLVFDKAVDEPGFCELYARMCKVIAHNHNKFFYHLIKKCQEEFETNDLYDGLKVDARKEEIEKETDLQKKKLMSEELYEDMRLRRKKYLGTIKLIGEMYKFGLLIPKIIGFCMKQLIDAVSNENLECLCSLLATVGAKMASENDEQVRGVLTQTLKILHDFAHSKKLEQFVLESRIKFKILDTIDLSKKNWKPRMVENNPKKIEEIREEVKEDKLRQQQQNHMNQSRSMSRNNDDRDRHRRMGNNSYQPKNQNSKWS